MLKKLVVVISMVALTLQSAPVFAAQPGKGGPQGDHRSDFRGDDHRDSHKDYRNDNRNDHRNDYRNDRRDDYRRDWRGVYHREVVVRHLPPKHHRFVLRGLTYYFFEGLFYRYTLAGYMIVPPPTGVIVPVQPQPYPYNAYGAPYSYAYAY